MAQNARVYTTPTGFIHPHVACYPRGWCKSNEHFTVKIKMCSRTYHPWHCLPMLPVYPSLFGGSYDNDNTTKRRTRRTVRVLEVNDPDVLPLVITRPSTRSSVQTLPRFQMRSPAAIPASSLCVLACQDSDMIHKCVVCSYYMLGHYWDGEGVGGVFAEFIYFGTLSQYWTQVTSMNQFFIWWFKQPSVETVCFRQQSCYTSDVTHAPRTIIHTYTKRRYEYIFPGYFSIIPTVKTPSG